MSDYFSVPPPHRTTSFCHASCFFSPRCPEDIFIPTVFLSDLSSTPISINAVRIAIVTSFYLSLSSTVSVFSPPYPCIITQRIGILLSPTLPTSSESESCLTFYYRSTPRYRSRNRNRAAAADVVIRSMRRLKRSTRDYYSDHRLHRR